MKSKVAACLSFGSFVGLVFGIASVATPVWEQSSTTSVGLFERCIENICSDYLGGANIRAIQTFFILGLIFTLLCIGLTAFTATDITDDKRVRHASILCFLLTGICYLIAMASFTGTYTLSEGSGYGYSFAFGWLVFCLSWFYFVISILFLR